MPDDNRGLFAQGLRKWQKESGNVENLSEYMPIGYGRPVDEFDKTWNPDDSIHGGFWQGGKHWSEVLADDANDLIDDAANNQSPFFMYLFIGRSLRFIVIAYLIYNGIKIISALSQK